MWESVRCPAMRGLHRQAQEAVREVLALLSGALRPCARTSDADTLGVVGVRSVEVMMPRTKRSAVICICGHHRSAHSFGEHAILGCGVPLCQCPSFVTNAQLRWAKNEDVYLRRLKEGRARIAEEAARS